MKVGDVNKLPKSNISSVCEGALSLEAVQELIDELRVHQTVLEMQNEELCKAVAELDRSKAHYSDFYDMAPVGFITLNEFDLIEQANLTTGSLLGANHSALINQPISNFIHKDHLETYKRHRNQLINSKSSQLCELLMLKQGGVPFWGRMESLAVASESGSILLRIVLSDNSESRQLDELKINSTFQRAILDSMTASIAVIDPEGVIIAANESWWRSSLENSIKPGIPTPGTDLGSNYLKACMSTDAEGAYRGIRSVLDGSLSRFTVEYPCHTPKQERWFNMIVTPLGRNAKFGAVVTHADVTEAKKSVLKLQESESKLQEIINLMPIELFVKDVSSNLILMNKACEEKWGIPFTDLRGSDGSDFFPPEQMKLFLSKDKEIFASGELVDFEEEVWSQQTRSNRLMRTFKKPIYNEYGKPLFMICMSLDMTERKLAEQKLQESENLYHSVVSTLHEGVILHERDGTITTWNLAAEKILGMSGDQLRGRSSMDPRWCAIHENGSDFVGETHPSTTALRTGKPQSNVIMGVHKPTGELSWISINAVPIFASNDPLPISVVVSFSDITEQKKIHAALIENQRLQANESILLQGALKRLRSLSADNQAAIENEKKHIARELHDELGQLLAALRMDIGLVKMEYALGLPELVPKANKMLETLDRALFSMRHLVSNLRPVVLDMGLQAALEWLRDDFMQMFGIPCSLNFTQPVPNMREMELIAVFRVVQESLTNVAKHSQSRLVQINVEVDRTSLRISVKDNGVGFEFDARSHRNIAKGNHRSFGLQGMQERMNAFNGSVLIDTAIGRGCCVTLSMPIGEKTDD